LPDVTQDRCPSCGAAIEGGQKGCEAVFNEIGARAFRDPRLGSVQQLVVDAYCLQHPEPYCHSAKSYAAHLTRMCCGLERGGNQQVYAAIPRWLNGLANLEKPAPPDFRGRITIADVRAAANVEDHKRVVTEWARDVWAAYSSLHALARQWLDAALAVSNRPAKKKK
jgi:hypothetical protein